MPESEPKPKLIELVGPGGGQGWKAVLKSGKPAVVHEIPIPQAEAAAAVPRLQRLYDHRHPALSPVLAWGTDQQGVWVAVEPNEGTSLGSILSRGPLTPPAAAALGTAVLSGVAALHEAGIAMGGFGATAVRVTSNGEVRIAGHPAAAVRGAPSQSDLRADVRSGGMAVCAAFGVDPAGAPAPPNIPPGLVVTMRSMASGAMGPSADRAQGALREMAAPSSPPTARTPRRPSSPPGRAAGRSPRSPRSYPLARLRLPARPWRRTLRLTSRRPGVRTPPCAPPRPTTRPTGRSRHIPPCRPSHSRRRPPPPPPRLSLSHPRRARRASLRGRRPQRLHSRPSRPLRPARPTRRLPRLLSPPSRLSPSLLLRRAAGRPRHPPLRRPRRCRPRPRRSAPLHPHPPHPRPRRPYPRLRRPRRPGHRSRRRCGSLAQPSPPSRLGLARPSSNRPDPRTRRRPHRSGPRPPPERRPPPRFQPDGQACLGLPRVPLECAMSGLPG